MANTLPDEMKNIQQLINGLIASLVLFRCLLILTDARRDEQPLGVAVERCKKIVSAGVIAFFLPDYISIISGTGYFSGTQKLTTLGYQICVLLKVTSNMITGLAAMMTVVNVIKEGLAWQAAADEQKPIHCEKIKKVLVVGILIVTGSGILSAIFGYFSVPTRRI